MTGSRKFQEILKIVQHNNNDKKRISRFLYRNFIDEEKMKNFCLQESKYLRIKKKYEQSNQGVYKKIK